MEQWLIQPGDTLVLELDDVRTLKTSLLGGQVDVIGHDSPTTRIEVHSVAGKELEITQNGSALEVDHPQLRWDNFIDVFRNWRLSGARADVSIAVPRDVALTLGVVSASALVAGLARPARLNTVSGDIMVDGCAGHLELNGVGAELSVRGHDGPLTAHTVSGDITVTGALSRVTTETVSGDVVIDSTVARSTITANAVSGNVVVRLHSDTGCRYTINTISGRLQLDDGTPIRVSGHGHTGTTGSPAGDWAELRAKTVSGNITVLHVADAPTAPGQPAGPGEPAGPAGHPQGATA